MVGTAMKLTCSRDEFVSSLGIVSRAVSTRSSVQILAGVLLRASGGEVHLAATDMELSLRTSLDAQVEDEGSVVVPGRLLVDLARLLPDSEVQLEHRADEAVLTIVCGTASYRLNTYSAEDFPRLPEIDDTQSSPLTRRRCSRRSRRSHGPRRVTSRAPCSPAFSRGSSLGSS
jgi:DNA polymerase sliding clamp subunit (PCNA homolog)